MKQRHIGRITAGILFIALGGLLLANYLTDFPITHILTQGWPIIFVLLGLEVIIAHRLKKEDEKFSFDFWSIFILTIVALFVIAGYSFKFNGFSNLFSDIIEPKYAVEMERTLELPEHVSEVRLDIPNARVDLLGTEGRDMGLTGQIKLNAEDQQEAASLAESHFTTEIVGNTLHIKLEKADHFRNFFFFLGNNLQADLEISLPEQLMLVAKITNGRLSATNFEGDGTFTSTNGNLTLSNLVGQIEARSTNAKLELSNIDGALQAQTTNGNIQVENISGEMSLRSTNGRIRVDSTHLTGDWDITTTNGGLNLVIPAASDASIQAVTTNGRIEGNIDWSISGKRSNNGLAILGNGSHQLQLQTTNGSIHVSEK